MNNPIFLATLMVSRSTTKRNTHQSLWTPLSKKRRRWSQAAAQPPFAVAFGPTTTTPGTRCPTCPLPGHISAAKPQRTPLGDQMARYALRDQMEQSIQGDRISLELHQVPGAWLIEESNSPLHGIAFASLSWTRTHVAPCAAMSSIAF